MKNYTIRGQTYLQKMCSYLVSPLGHPSILTINLKNETIQCIKGTYVQSQTVKLKVEATLELPYTMVYY